MRVFARAGLLLVVALQVVTGGYVITTPRKWTEGVKHQVCVSVDLPRPGDVFRVALAKKEPFRHSWIRREPDESSKFVPGFITPVTEMILNPSGYTCESFLMPETEERDAKLHVEGVLGGVQVDLKNVTFAVSLNEKIKKTFIQTDKFLYRDGQKVQFRILNLEGPFFQVMTNTYSAIWVENPSGSRIAQWLNVSNPSGLVHLDFQLVDEAEQGQYAIKVRNNAGDSSREMTTKHFKVEDYVLPRFELTLTPPAYFLATEETMHLDVCVKYTFGQPVRGNIVVTVKNNGWRRRHKKSAEFRFPIFGCKKVDIPMRQLDINSEDYYVYNVGVNVHFEEDGTGSESKESTEVHVTRTVLTLKDTNSDHDVAKPELPLAKSIKVSLPDGKPAALEPMSVCLSNVCKNATTDSTGHLHFVIPPHLTNASNIDMKALNYPGQKLEGHTRYYMHRSAKNFPIQQVYSPSNSSLLMVPEKSSFGCPSNGTSIEIPVMFSASNMTETVVYIQAVSRGQIQHWSTQKVEFKESPLNVDEKNLIEPIEKPKQSEIVRGQFTISLTLKTNESPRVTVLIWYKRYDGEVVADHRALKVAACLNNDVKLSWPKPRAEQGTPSSLTLTGRPNSLCSIGVVDKSVELLMEGEDSLTVEKVFGMAEKAQVGEYDNNPLNDNNEYCRKQFPEKEEKVESTTPVNQPPLPPMDPEIRKRRSIMPHGNRYTSDEKDAKSEFVGAGLHVISDLTLETRRCKEDNYHYKMGTTISFGFPTSTTPRIIMALATTTNRPVPLLANPLPAPEQSPPQKEPAVVERSYLPETWLWQIISLNRSTGEFKQELTLPDTITEWVGKAVCVHPTAGLGLSPSTSIVTFTPFFVDLTVLPSIKKGEIMPIVVSVFNYQDQSIPVRVVLENSPDYEVLGVEGDQASPDQSKAGHKSLCLPVQDKGTVTFRVRPLSVGDVNITVMAAVDPDYPEPCGPEIIINKVDRIVKSINVDYEGFPHEKTLSKYMCMKDLKDDLDVFEEWTLEAPADIVEDSTRSYVTVVGDLLGPTLENLEHLIRMPSGCGEQNMVGFAPNIFVMKYLDATNLNNNETADKLRTNMRSGYQRELKYKHPDGSYSAFGERDKTGSTWLTAFVLKSFSQAKKYIDIDEEELNISRRFLTGLQLENGCFESVGKVFHKGMKGGLKEGNNPRILAAYIMAALLEAGEPRDSPVITNALYCVQGGAEEVLTPETYEAAQIAYALARGNFTARATNFTESLLSLATGSAANLYFEDIGNAGKGVGVETAGYALLALMALDRTKYEPQAHGLIKWISAQRNSQGGFVSTQDTIVALEGIATFEEGQAKEPADLTLSVAGSDLKGNPTDWPGKTFKVSESNKLLTQRVDVPSVPSKVSFDMAGTGCALVQSVVRYNVKNADPSEAFNITVATSFQGQSCKIRNIKTCAKYLAPDGVSNMAIIEINVVSGNIPVKADLKAAVGLGQNNIKRYEVDGSKVMFYIDELSIEETCVEFGVKQEAVVEHAKPGTVKVYDYYNPDLTLSMNYELPSNSRPSDCPKPLPSPPSITTSLPPLPAPLPIIIGGEGGRPPLPLLMREDAPPAPPGLLLPLLPGPPGPPAPRMIGGGPPGTFN